MPDRANRQVGEILWFIGQHDPGHARRIPEKHARSLPIRRVNRERAEARVHRAAAEQAIDEKAEHGGHDATSSCWLAHAPLT